MDQETLRLCADVGRDAIVSACNSAADCAESIRVTADGDCITDRVFEGIRLKERLQHLRNGSLARDVELVRGTAIAPRSSPPVFQSISAAAIASVITVSSVKRQGCRDSFAPFRNVKFLLLRLRNSNRDPTMSPTIAPIILFLLPISYSPLTPKSYTDFSQFRIQQQPVARRSCGGRLTIFK